MKLSMYCINKNKITVCAAKHQTANKYTNIKCSLTVRKNQNIHTDTATTIPYTMAFVQDGWFA